MKFKFKINENTTLDDVRIELDSIRSANVKEIPLNHLIRIIEFLGAKSVPVKGSSVRFSHTALKEFPQYQGYFSVHKIHKGGDKDEIRMVDYKKYLYPALITIIKEKENK
jgi:hypothetical protein